MEYRTVNSYADWGCIGTIGMGDKTSHPESPEAVSDRVHGGAESD